MSGEMDLGKIAVFEDDEGTWFPFSDDPFFSGFEIKLRFLDPKTIDRIRRNWLSWAYGEDAQEADAPP